LNPPITQGDISVQTNTTVGEIRKHYSPQYIGLYLSLPSELVVITIDYERNSFLVTVANLAPYAVPVNPTYGVLDLNGEDYSPSEPKLNFERKDYIQTTRHKKAGVLGP